MVNNSRPSGLGQSQKCSRVKPVNRIPTPPPQPNLIRFASNRQDNTTFAYEGSIYLCVDQTRTYTTLLFTLQMHCPIILVLNHLYLSAK